MAKPVKMLRFMLVVRYDEYKKSDESYIGHLAGIVVRKSRKKWIPLKNGVIRVEPSLRWKKFIDCIVSFPAGLIEIQSINPLFSDYIFISNTAKISFFTASGGKLIHYDKDLIVIEEEGENPF